MIFSLDLGSQLALLPGTKGAISPRNYVPMKNVARTLSYKALQAIDEKKAARKKGLLYAFANSFFHTPEVRKWAKARRIAVKN